MLRRIAGVLAAVSLTGAAQAATAPATCGEACLLGVASAYMDSLSANDPAGAPFAARLRATENGKETPPTAGIWTTAQAWGYRHTMVDPVNGQVVAFGTVREASGKDAMVGIRLKVVARRIAESELLVTRAGDTGILEPRFATEPRAIYKAYLPPDRRNTRAELEAVATNYFRAIATGNPRLVSVHPDANRVENGVQTTNGPTRPSASISEGLNRLIYMQRFRQTRIPVVDTERGLVLAITAFDMPELNKTITVRGKPVEFSNVRQRLPRTLFLYELFKVDRGQIQGIEAVMRDMPLGADMGWPATK